MTNEKFHEHCYRHGPHAHKHGTHEQKFHCSYLLFVCAGSVFLSFLKFQATKMYPTWKKFVMIGNTKKQRKMIADITALGIN